ncbi:hypothetical protein AB0J47_09360 [Nocardia sp. NPDC049737]|uniref:hypothetical protein n=1 Tax=Nocardia sp. NPDC049737 TaxID=3154358 RepID=UPI003413EBEE
MAAAGPAGVTRSDAMAWDFETDPEHQKKLEWADEFVRAEVEPLDFVWEHEQFVPLDGVAQGDPRNRGSLSAQFELLVPATRRHRGGAAVPRVTAASDPV